MVRVLLYSESILAERMNCALCIEPYSTVCDLSQILYFIPFTFSFVFDEGRSLSAVCGRFDGGWWVQFVLDGIMCLGIVWLGGLSLFSLGNNELFSKTNN